MKYLIVLATLLTGTLSYTSHEQLQSQWQNFKQVHQKSYNRREELKRVQIFHDNLEKIEKHNNLYEKRKVSYRMGVNQFADLTPLEFLQYIKTYKFNGTKPNNAVRFERPSTSLIPDEIDWREKGAVTQVKDQSACGAWMYGVTGALEGQNFLETGHLVSLSEQELVDCAVSNGCSGGFVDDGYKYVIEHGLSAEADYPKEPSDGNCHRGSIPSAVTENGYVVITGNEEALREAVGTVGPISVSVDATSNWQFYSGGILLDNECSSAELNHVVLAVGYGAEHKDDYWLLKNSWGVSWGEEGYIRTARNRNNNCGIATYPTYPTV